MAGNQDDLVVDWVDDLNQNPPCRHLLVETEAQIEHHVEEAEVGVSEVECGEEATEEAVSVVAVVASEAEEAVALAVVVSVVVIETVGMAVAVVADSGTSLSRPQPNLKLTEGMLPLVVAEAEESDSKEDSTSTDLDPTDSAEDLPTVLVDSAHPVQDLAVPLEEGLEDLLVGMAAVLPEAALEVEDSSVKDQACMTNATRSVPGIRQVWRLWTRTTRHIADVGCVSDQGCVVSLPPFAFSFSLALSFLILLSHLSVMRKYSRPYYVYPFDR